MSILNKYSNKSPFLNLVKGQEFKKPQELFEMGITIIPIHGMFINTGQYGEFANVNGDGYNFPLPKHMTDTVKAMLQDNEVIDLINVGKVACEFYPYEKKEGKGENEKTSTYYGVNFIEVVYDDEGNIPV